MQDAIVINTFVADQVKNAMIHGRVIFFSAPCGFGKTTTAWALLEGKKVYFTAAGGAGLSPAPAAGDVGRAAAGPAAKPAGGGAGASV